MIKINLAIFISGKGTNLKSISDACKKNNFPAKIKLVISDKDCDGYHLSKSLSHETILLNNCKTKLEFETKANNLLLSKKIDLICLAGFMKILSPNFVKNWKNRILNIHPSILPFFPGLDTHRQVISAGMKIHGSTIHIVENKLDSGPILAQCAIPINPDEKIKLLEKRLKKFENILYVKAIEKFVKLNFQSKKNKPFKNTKNNYNKVIFSI